jgi:hypothetical protein
MGRGKLKNVQLRKVEEHDDREISLNKPQKTSVFYLPTDALYYSLRKH